MNTFFTNKSPASWQHIVIFGSGPAFRASSLASVIFHSPWQKLSLKQTFFHRFESRRIHDIEVSSQPFEMSCQHSAFDKPAKFVCDAL